MTLPRCDSPGPKKLQILLSIQTSLFKKKHPSYFFQATTSNPSSSYQTNRQISLPCYSKFSHFPHYPWTQKAPNKQSNTPGNPQLKDRIDFKAPLPDRIVIVTGKKYLLSGQPTRTLPTPAPEEIFLSVPQPTDPPPRHSPSPFIPGQSAVLDATYRIRNCYPISHILLSTF